MSRTDEFAQKIYQSILDGSGDAVHLQDFDRYRPFFLFPHVLDTFEGRTVIDTPEALRAAFDTVQACLGNLGVTRMERTCTMAEFADDRTIQGVHTTRLVGVEGTVVDTYAGLCTLRRVDGQWRVAISQFAEEQVSLPSRTLRNYTRGPDRAEAAQ